MSSNLKIFCVASFLFFGSIFSLDAYPEDVSKCCIEKIIIQKNTKTRSSVILRELEFSESDTLRIEDVSTLLEGSKQNLMNTSLFNFVTVKPVWNSDSTSIDVEIEVLERWYVWPIPLFEVADGNLNSWWKEKDLSRLNYGMLLKWDNFSGRKDLLKVLLRLGHEDKWGLFYELPSFNKKQNLGFDFGISYARHHEIGVESVNNILIYSIIATIIIIAITAIVSLVLANNISNPIKRISELNFENEQNMFNSVKIIRSEYLKKALKSIVCIIAILTVALSYLVFVYLPYLNSNSFIYLIMGKYPSGSNIFPLNLTLSWSLFSTSIFLIIYLKDLIFQHLFFQLLESLHHFL